MTSFSFDIEVLLSRKDELEEHKYVCDVGLMHDASSGRHAISTQTTD
jgi:hypothetical protein